MPTPCYLVTTLPHSLTHSLALSAISRSVIWVLTHPPTHPFMPSLTIAHSPSLTLTDFVFYFYIFFLCFLQDVFPSLFYGRIYLPSDIGYFTYLFFSHPLAYSLLQLVEAHSLDYFCLKSVTQTHPLSTYLHLTHLLTHSFTYTLIYSLTDNLPFTLMLFLCSSQHCIPLFDLWPNIFVK